MQAEHLEIHLPAGALGKYCKLIKALGGESGRPSSSDKRFIKLPTTPEGVDLAAELVREFGSPKTVVIFRPRGLGYTDNEKATKIQYFGKNLGTAVLLAWVEMRQAHVRELIRLADEAVLQAQEDAERRRLSSVERCRELLVPQTLQRLLNWVEAPRDRAMGPTQARLNELENILQCVQALELSQEHDRYMATQEPAGV